VSNKHWQQLSQVPFNTNTVCASAYGLNHTILQDALCVQQIDFACISTPDPPTTDASEQAEISGETDMTTNVLLKAGEVLKSKTAAYTIGKQLQGTVWLAT
jgi:hypothetical protein